MTPTGVPHVALLRGINVGGKNMLPMADLAKVFVDHGCLDVRTYIQSGNVLFRTSGTVLKSLSAKISRAIQDRFDFEVPVVLRSRTEMDAVVTGNPFARAGVGWDHVHVAFLKDRPSGARVAALDPTRSPGDAFRVVGRDVFLHLPDGVARTKLSNAWLDRALSTMSTVRNGRTVLELHRRLSSLG